MELIDAAASSSLDRAVQVLRGGGVIAYPTETVYGLGVDPFNRSALDALFHVKGRNREKALLLIVGATDHLDTITSNIPARARACMEKFWPGPLSILLPKHPDLPDEVAPGLDKVCVRCPGLTTARNLCDAFGGAITSTSANASGEVPVTRLSDLSLEGITLGLDAGTLPPSDVSTIIDGDTGEVLRSGAISPDEVMALFRS